MTAVASYSIRCDCCGDHFTGVLSEQDSANRARRASKKAGWVYHVVDHEGVDYCPACNVIYSMKAPNEEQA